MNKTIYILLIITYFLIFSILSINPVTTNNTQNVDTFKSDHLDPKTFKPSSSNKLSSDNITITKPSPPVNLTGILNGTTVTLKWEPPSDDGGTEILYYNVFRGTSRAFLYVKRDYCYMGNTTHLTYKDNNFDEWYYYAVSAVNAKGESEICPYIRVPPRDTTITTTTIDDNTSIETSISQQTTLESSNYTETDTVSKTVNASLVTTFIIFPLIGIIRYRKRN